MVLSINCLERTCKQMVLDPYLWDYLTALVLMQQKTFDDLEAYAYQEIV